jgi:hypothetical protein
MLNSKSLLGCSNMVDARIMNLRLYQVRPYKELQPQRGVLQATAIFTFQGEFNEWDGLDQP